ncbi:MAG: IS66 family insertion sequence element accessory protein TnpB [Pseudoalteromonas rhizosphaerae]|uniref:IS66 family insertion sequence element accessory protein TnpA n=1 Tax=Pseudoalteromonas rhizosphaerae TaxID=2518973 RepID=UPI003C7969B9
MMNRIQRNAAQWANLIEAQKQSDLNIKEYCQQNALTTSNFYAWRKRLKTVKIEPTSPFNNEHQIQADWLKLDLDSKPAIKKWDIELHLPNGCVLKMNQALC